MIDPMEDLHPGDEHLLGDLVREAAEHETVIGQAKLGARPRQRSRAFAVIRLIELGDVAALGGIPMRFREEQRFYQNI